METLSITVPCLTQTNYLMFYVDYNIYLCHPKATLIFLSNMGILLKLPLSTIWKCLWVNICTTPLNGTHNLAMQWSPMNLLKLTNNMISMSTSPSAMVTKASKYYNVGRARSCPWARATTLILHF